MSPCVLRGLKLAAVYPTAVFYHPRLMNSERLFSPCTGQPYYVLARETGRNFVNIDESTSVTLHKCAPGCVPA